MLNQLLSVISQLKVPEACEPYFSTDLAAGRRFDVCMSVCMYMCDDSTGHNFYPTATKFGTEVGLIKRQVTFENGVCRSHMDY